MKRIRIDGIQKLIGEDFMKFRILDVIDRDNDYLLSIVSKPLGGVYHLSIHKEARRERGEHKLLIWDKRRDKTYPMSLDKGDLESRQRFIYIMDSIVGTCDVGGFQGNKGNDTLIIK